MTWKTTSGVTRNLVLEGDDFFVSYVSAENALDGPFAPDGGGDETALVKDGDFYILNGDFRESYERLVPEGFDACKRFYDQQKAHANSSWSDDKDIH